MTLAADPIEGAPDERGAQRGPDQDSVTARLDVLDRRMKRVAMIGLAGVTASLALAGAALYAASGARALTRDGVVQARRLVLADGAGRPRVVLATDPNGAASLYFTDTTGRARATLGVGADGAPALGLGDAAGILRAAVAVGAKGETSVGFFDPQRNVRARLGLGADAVPALDMFDDRELNRVKLSVEPGRSLLRIADRSGHTRIGLGLAAGAPGLVVFDENGAPVRELR